MNCQRQFRYPVSGDGCPVGDLEPDTRDPEPGAALAATVSEWMGTPFMRGSRAKGRDGGCDCVTFVEELYYALGAIPAKYPFPKYTVDWAKHNRRSLLMEHLEAHYADSFREAPVDPDGLRLGDLLLMAPPDGLCIHHAGVYHRPGYFAHAMRTRGVIETWIRGTSYGFRLEKVWRPVEIFHQGGEGDA